MKKTSRFEMKMDPNFKALLQDKAKELGMTTSSYITMILKKHIKESEDKK